MLRFSPNRRIAFKYVHIFKINKIELTVSPHPRTVPCTQYTFNTYMLTNDSGSESVKYISLYHSLEAPENDEQTETTHKKFGFPSSNMAIMSIQNKVKMNWKYFTSMNC